MSGTKMKTNMIWIMKLARLPCQNAYMGLDQVRTAAGIEFFRLGAQVVFRTLEADYASSDIDYS
jgi:hypothetical protein